MKPASDPRAHDLLVERAQRPLEDSEAWQLRELGAEGDDSFDLAAASAALAMTPIEPMPAELAAKVLNQSPAGFRTIPGVMPSQLRPAPVIAPTPPVTDLERAREKKTSRFAQIAPWIAAAACLALAIGAVLWASDQKRENKPVVITPPVTPTPTAKELREKLLATASDVSMLQWSATEDPNGKGAAGDVVWSHSEQRGFMRFVGLTPNDAKQFQYQLWIFDKNRDDKYPVDGGVFDVSSTGEIIVPISAKLPVSDATLFAVTVEKPGGVVVSARERIVVTAARKT